MKLYLLCTFVFSNSPYLSYLAKRAKTTTLDAIHDTVHKVVQRSMTGLTLNNLYQLLYLEYNVVNPRSYELTPTEYLPMI